MQSMSFAVVQGNIIDANLSVAQRNADWLGCFREDSAMTLPVGRRCIAKTSYDFVTQVAGNLLSAVIPEENLPVDVDEADARLQAIQNGTIEIQAIQFGHTFPVS
jgi:hypothetical protein